MRSAATAAKVMGSCAVTPNSKLLIKRVNAKAALIPIATPTRAIFVPCRSTMCSTFACCAPSAKRIPISR